MIGMDLEVEYRQHVEAMLHFATVLVGPSDAADVVSDVVTTTLARRSLDGVADIRAYWLRSVANTAADRHRSASRRVLRERRTAGRGVQVDELDAEGARAILAPLSVQQRAIVYLAYWHDRTPAEVATALGVSEGTVRKQLARSRARLREVLTDDR